MDGSSQIMSNVVKNQEICSNIRKARRILQWYVER